MKPKADIARVGVFVKDATDRYRPALPAWHNASAPMQDWNLLDQPEPDVEFDQRVARSSPFYAGDGAAALVRQPSTAPRGRVRDHGRTRFSLPREAEERQHGVLTDP
jgi:hypothetical protein